MFGSRQALTGCVRFDVPQGTGTLLDGDDAMRSLMIACRF